MLGIFILYKVTDGVNPSPHSGKKIFSKIFGRYSIAVGTRKAKRQTGKQAKRQKGEKEKGRKGEKEKRRKGEKEKRRKEKRRKGEKRFSRRWKGVFNGKAFLIQ